MNGPTSEGFVFSVDVCNALTGYEESIRRLVEGGFDAAPVSDGIQPEAREGMPEKRMIATLDAIYLELVGSKKHRVGARPDLDGMIATRSVMQEAWLLKKPIPILVPWGSKKPDGRAADVAELSALLTIRCLQERVSQVYPPGIRVNFRLEDLSGRYLHGDNVDNYHAINLYCASFRSILRALDMPYCTIRQESDMTFYDAIGAACKPIEILLRVYLWDTKDEDVPEAWPEGGEPATYQLLKQAGWRGAISTAQREHYFELYRRNYPDETVAEHRNKLARYFALAYGRNKLGITGADPNWGDRFIKLSFTPQVPGAFAPTTLYYRTIPADISRVHVAPWRSRGYFQMDASRPGEVSPRLTTIRSPEFGHWLQRHVKAMFQIREGCRTLESLNAYPARVISDYVVVQHETKNTETESEDN